MNDPKHALGSMSRPVHAHLLRRNVTDGSDAVRIAAGFTRVFGAERACTLADLFLNAGWQAHEIVALMTFDDSAWKKQPWIVLDAEQVLRESGINPVIARAAVIARPHYGCGLIAQLRDTLAFLHNLGFTGDELGIIAKQHPASFYLSTQRLERIREAVIHITSDVERRIECMEYLLNRKALPPAPKPQRPSKPREPPPPRVRQTPRVPVPVPLVRAAPKPAIPAPAAPTNGKRKNEKRRPEITPEQIENRRREQFFKNISKALRRALEAVRSPVTDGAWKKFQDSHPEIFQHLHEVAASYIELQRWIELPEHEAKTFIGGILADHELRHILTTSAKILGERMYILRANLELDFVDNPILLLLPLETVPDHELRFRIHMTRNGGEVPWTAETISLLLEPTREAFLQSLHAHNTTENTPQ